MNKYSVVILRVSTREQDTATQRKLLTDEVVKRGLIPVEWGDFKMLPGGMASEPNLCIMIEDYASGRQQERKTYKWVIEQVKARRVLSVFAYRHDRIGRSAQASLAFAEACRTTGTELHSLRDNIDLTSASGKYLYHTLVGAAQFESDLISERVRDAYDYLKSEADKKGEKVRWGGRPKGCTNAETAKLLPRLKMMIQENMSIRHMSRVLGLDPKTCRKWRKRLLGGEGFTVAK